MRICGSDNVDGVREIFFGVPRLETIRDGGEDFAPLGEATADSTDGVSGLLLIDGAGLGAKTTLGGLSDITGAEDPESEEGFNSDDDRPDGDENEEETEYF